MKRKFLYIKTTFIAIILLVACNDADKVEAEIAKINIDLNVSRFDREFAEATPSDLPKLKKIYPYLFPRQYPDSIWELKLKDTIQIELFDEVGKTFNDLELEKKELKALFQHIKYYFPQFTVPKVITLTSEVDYNSQVILADSLLLISLDTYLGPEHHFYQDIQNYIANGLDRKFMISDVAENFAYQVVPRLNDRTFLSNMLYYGKILYLKDKLMPNADHAIKMKYSQDQLEWAMANEEPIWRNFIEQEHLYSTDKVLNLRFLEPAPFSKFGLELDNESPGRLGQYIGWQIVDSFMRSNEITLQQLFRIPAEELFKKSKYTPSR